MGFERVDEIAREMAARPRPRARRSQVVRWAILVWLGIVGAIGALYFVIGGSGRSPALPRKGPEVATSSGARATPQAVTAPTVQLSARDAADGRAARAAQIAVVLDDLDATLHGLRLTWPGVMGTAGWTEPVWLTPERMAEELAALDSQLSGASDALSLEARAWIAVARVDGARLFALRAAWSAPGAPVEAITAELRPLFDRLVAASAAVHAAVAADLQAPPPGTMASLAAACRVAPLLARLPPMGAAEAAVPPAVVNADQLRLVADACLEATGAYLRANPGGELNDADIYRVSLTTSLAVNLLHEHERRRRRDAEGPGTFMSAAGNLAQESSLLAISRREDDPSLRPAEAEAGALPR